jgi:chromosome segregation protein
MYLKSLELAGFKSFGSRSVLELNKGLVAVVGPNGSGKSNVADAIRWVLGEQSTRALRLNKSEELIFAGTDKKPMASMAEVSLLLDNAQGKMPVDAPEVEITRRLYRNGESEYRLNGRKVRLHELQDLLAKGWLWAELLCGDRPGHGGEASMLTSPAERKVLFEEASGTKAIRAAQGPPLKEP